MQIETNEFLACSAQTVKYSTLSERLRPRSIDELLLPDSIINKLQRMVDTQEVMNMIFYGSPGTGKTSCAHLMNGENGFCNMLYLNAAKDNGIDDMKKKVENYATSKSLFGGMKIVILDEADHLSNSAQASLRGLIELTSQNCRYILTANKLAKIQEPLKSRCRPICFDAPYQLLDALIAKLIRTIKSRLMEIGQTVDESKLRQLVTLKFPDYRAIANNIEFELL